MNQQEESLEMELAGLTQWHEAPPQLWRRAAAAANVSKPSRWFAETMWRPLRMRHLAAIAAIVLVALGIVSLMLPSLSRARATSMALMQRGDMRSIGQAGPHVAQWNDRAFPSLQGVYETTAGNVAARSFNTALGAGGAGSTAAIFDGQDTPFEPPAAVDRQVMRKATVEFTTDDVRAAFLKAMQVVSEAAGEFVQDSTLTGAGKDAQASLTLRVRADRLATVLNELRALGTVRAESASGEDVTSQVIDLEARLRNEQHVEKEMLELLDRRPEAPLKEILDLRDKINQVRGQIEHLTAQRERLGRLVSLATVLVIIRTADAPTEPVAEKPQGMGEYFLSSLGLAWKGGMRVLADTVAGGVGVLVGGLVWWLLLVAVVLLTRRYWRRHVATTPDQSAT